MKKFKNVVFVIGLVLSAVFARAENPVPVGSIRPLHKIAKVDLPSVARISFETALKSALAVVPGGVIRAELEVEDGTLLYSFEIVGADKNMTEVEIDAGNGKVLATENEKPTSTKKRE